MKIAVLYYSRGGTTRRMAQAICRGACSVPGCQAMAFPLEEVDKAFLEESRAVIFGTPTYYAGEAWPVKKWVDESRPYQLAGKLYELGIGESRYRPICTSIPVSPLAQMSI